MRRAGQAALAGVLLCTVVASARWATDEAADFKWRLRARAVDVMHGRPALGRGGIVPTSAANQPIPRTWDEKALARMELPIASLEGAHKTYVSADYYYRIPVRPIYKTYPVYAPGREPSGYKAWLKQQKPEIVFDPATLNTPADWVKAGKLVFHSPIAYDVLVSEEDVVDPRWHESIRPPVTKDGILPFIRYGIREPGKVEVGILACATCHSRVLENGELVDGLQGNFRYNASIAWSYRRQTPDWVRKDVRMMYGLPWMPSDPLARLYNTGSIDVIGQHEEAMPAGMVARNGTSPLTPTPVPNLIGVKDYRYLDHTGLVQHRDIGDMMRYFALAQGIDFVSSYGDYIPRAEGTPPVRPKPETLEAKRYSDEQLYALANYVYSLKPPSNPHRDDPRAADGRRVFDRERCARCHTPPLYTNNMLMPVEGFQVPSDHQSSYRVMNRKIGTQPDLALRTRRGTGYYKVPSLRGVWSREMLGHSGYVRCLEDWFDPARVRPDYTPTGFRPPGLQHFAVTGHPYGLDLPTSERASLIAFLKTLE
jgi:hypothetical protein